MANFDDITKKARVFPSDDKVQDALKSEQAEDISGEVFDGAEDVINKVIGNKLAEQIGRACDEAGKHLGDK